MQTTAQTNSGHVAVPVESADASLTDEQLVAAVHKACGTGLVKLTFPNNKGIEKPTDVAKCFAKALYDRAAIDDLVKALQYVLEDDGSLPRATSKCRDVVRAALAKAGAA